MKFAVMASGGGTDFQSLIDAVQSGQINAEICCLVAGKPDIYAIERAKTAGIPVEVVQKKSFGTVEAFDEAILAALKAHAADFVVLAGYLSIIGKKTISAYRNKIINIHPSLIPSFCGMGMYGGKVHEAVIEYGAKFSGATVHFVDEEADTGPIIMQQVVPVMEDDTPEKLAARVLETEHRILPEAVALMADGKLLVEGRRVKVLK
ncbi:phosphoribosylglycinamide formyltransferase [Christensenella hongkongensis]|uniref:phosphoribosylglycinamide formyltransferase n=1 Tax=Christensenella hongkongensis TaxID=270498 RepID=UPI00104E9C34